MTTTTTTPTTAAITTINTIKTITASITRQLQQQAQLQLEHCNFNKINPTTTTTTTTTIRLLHYTTLHPGVVSEVTTATIATTPKAHNSNHLSVHQWIRSAIHASQQLTFPVVSHP